MNTAPQPRPAAEAVLNAVLDDRGRVRTEARRQVIAQVRCRRRHLLALVVGTAHGRWIARRGEPWSAWWAGERGKDALEGVGCTCPNRASRWWLSVAWLERQRGEVTATAEYLGERTA